ncbi:MAG: HlyC/CorC family transporter [Mogibacterium sp.]|nr:HlyC/CorC family transporter [Mogibacterium sp.]
MEDGSLPSYLFVILIILIMVFNGLVVACKRALDYIDRNVIKDMLEDEPENKRLRTVTEFISKPSKYHYADHAASFISIILCFFLFNILMLIIDLSDVQSDGFGFYKNGLGLLVLLLCNLGFYIIYTALSDILPKKLAAQSSETTGIGLIGFQKFIYIITLPLVWTCRGIANLILRIMGKKIDVDDTYFSEDKVMSMLDRGQESGEIKEEGRKMIDSIFEFDDLLAYEIMTPRTDVFMFDLDDDRSEYFEELMELTHSRIPVYKGDPDNIVGILHIKDYLYNATKKGFDNVDIKKLLRPAYFVPETKNVDALFRELQIEKQHLAILIDEYGGFSGIVSVEDIIEQIVGDIDDEFDEEDRIIEKVNDTTFIVDGNVYLDDLEEETGVELESETSETIGGFIIDLMGEIPRENVKYNPISYEDHDFTILSVRDRRIEKVRIEKVEREDDSDE